MIGKTIIELEKVGSTNTYATEMLLRSGFEEGTVVWAHEQFAGRGQSDRQWSSEAGKNLTFTVCLRPHFLEPSRQFRLNEAISLGILDFIRSYSVPASSVNPHASPVTRHPSLIKWPNDIYVGGNKIGGILIENIIRGPVFEAAFAGIGVNINQTRFAPDIPNPVSLIHILRHELVLKDALMTLCGILEKRYLELNHPADPERLDRDYASSLLGYGEWKSYRTTTGMLEGKINGVDPSGRLRVENRKGEELLFSHGEVTQSPNCTSSQTSR
jgi:BirA family biotin operon repressor/biotin-[acetyl-CoA-carboxylase] ligase